MEPAFSSTAFTCNAGVFSEPYFECASDCPVRTTPLTQNIERAGLKKNANAFYIVNGDPTVQYTSFYDMLADHPTVIKHGNEYQLLCATDSAPFTPYRVRFIGGGSHQFTRTFDKRYKFWGSFNFISSGDLLLPRKVVGYLFYIVYSSLAMAAVSVTATAIPGSSLLGANAPMLAGAFFGGNPRWVQQMRGVDKIFLKIWTTLNMFLRQPLIGWATSKLDQWGKQVERAALRSSNDSRKLWAITHTSAMLEYYGFACVDCFSNPGLMRAAQKRGGVSGPYKRVQCMYGQWTEDEITCSGLSDLTERSPKSTICVLCSQSWRFGRADALTMQGDAAFGSQIAPKWFMIGYHAWATHAVRTFDRVPVLQRLFPIEDGTLLLASIANRSSRGELSLSLLTGVVSDFVASSSSALYGVACFVNALIGFTSLIPLTFGAYLMVELSQLIGSNSINVDAGEFAINSISEKLSFEGSNEVFDGMVTGVSVVTWCVSVFFLFKSLVAMVKYFVSQKK
eukprot:GDKK01026566.1.p1 GENE.GDKK01026566.1~~GDKK01026566.1.p1  ORF type:complete len:560 (+),score=115.15 GDKK01026566.1:155-1681(+)